jgi:acetate kinase
MALSEDSLILVANPGSSSRKYAVYTADLSERAHLHIEREDGKLIGNIYAHGQHHSVAIDFDDLAESAVHLMEILQANDVIRDGEVLERIGLRVVAPSSFFMQDHVMNDEVIEHVESLRHLAPLHIDATLRELQSLRQTFTDATIVGVSDSAFHATKPPYAWNYGIDIHDADRLDIKRFGYHGISVSASINALWDTGKLPPKVVVCHLGSGSSVTGVFHGRSVDTTMGYTPLEGLIMATRSGSIDTSAARVLKESLNLDDTGLETYLNTKSGLLGIGGSNDIRELIARETDGDHMAHLALTTLIHSIHKAIGSMVVALNGCDLIVFTGTVGERSAILRKRIVAHLECLDFALDGEVNDACTTPDKMTFISQKAASKPIVVIPTDEAREIAQHTLNIVS